MTHEPNPLTVEDLERIEEENRYADEVEPGNQHGEDVRRLFADVRRLRQLVIDAEPYVPDNERTRTMDLPARLKAEVDRE